MEWIANICVGMVVLIHCYICYFEMFSWETTGKRIFNNAFPEDFFPKTKKIAANLGLYNGFLALGLFISFFIQEEMVQFYTRCFFLVCILVAAVYGAFTTSFGILFKQGLPAFLALLFVYFSSEEKKRFRLENPTDLFANPQRKVEELRDSLHRMQELSFDYHQFNAVYNEDSMDFFERNGIDDPKQFVTDRLLATNVTKDPHHPLIIYRPRQNEKFQINSVKLLNHRWLICDFSDGLDWGELLIKYYLNDANELEFEVFDQVLYISDRTPRERSPQEE